MDIITRLSALANSLDSAGLSYLADDIDGISDKFLKTAQYVGPQGYWIRNSRCWSNCYRQKRGASPEKAAQEVWQECQAEYVKYVEENSSDWDKYAESEALVKTAGLDNKFLTKISKQVGSGVSIPTAVYSTIENSVEKYRGEIIEMSGEIAKISDRLKLAGVDDKLCLESADLANEMVKLAGPMQWLGNKWNKAMNWNANRGAVNGVNQRGQALMQSFNGVATALGKWNETLNSTKQYIESLKQNRSPQVQANAPKALKLISDIYTKNFAKGVADNLQSRVNQLNDVMKTIPETPRQMPSGVNPGSGAGDWSGAGGQPNAPAPAQASGNGNTQGILQQLQNPKFVETWMPTLLQNLKNARPDMFGKAASTKKTIKVAVGAPQISIPQMVRYITQAYDAGGDDPVIQHLINSKVIQPNATKPAGQNSMMPTSKMLSTLRGSESTPGTTPAPAATGVYNAPGAGSTVGGQGIGTSTGRKPEFAATAPVQNVPPVDINAPATPIDSFGNAQFTQMPAEKPPVEQPMPTVNLSTPNVMNKPKRQYRKTPANAVAKTPTVPGSELKAQPVTAGKLSPQQMNSWQQAETKQGGNGLIQEVAGSKDPAKINSLRSYFQAKNNKLLVSALDKEIAEQSQPTEEAISEASTNFTKNKGILRTSQKNHRRLF